MRGTLRRWTSRPSGLPILGAAALLAVPKCPLCLLALGGVLGGATASVLAPIYRAGLAPLTVAALALAVGALALEARARGDARAPALATAGAAAVLAGKFWWPSVPLWTLGLAALLAAIWLARRRDREPPGPCRSCDRRTLAPPCLGARPDHAGGRG